jgi:CRP-like cAMP-binding protein
MTRGKRRLALRKAAKAQGPSTFHGHNGLLAAFNRGDREFLRPALEVVELQRGTVLYKAGDPVETIYFPHNAVVSLVAVMNDGRVAETGTIGREGFTGSETILGNIDAANSRWVVQVSGNASKVPLSTLRDFIDERPHARKLLMAYTRALFAQVLQSVACNATHSVEERCARWLLMTHDRAEADTFELTQEFLAVMLCVRRPSVNLVGRTFQKAGLIRYSRGKITILDRAGLEGASCECYGIVRQVFEQLLPHPSTK